MRATCFAIVVILGCSCTAAAEVTEVTVELLYVSDSANHLFVVDVLTGRAELIGETPVRFTDIAFSPGGRLYGVTSAYLYEIDPFSGATRLIGPHGYGGRTGTFAIDALAFGSDGTLYAAGNDILIAINPETVAAMTIGTLSGYRSAGDLAVDDAGRLLLTTDTADLVQVHLDGSGATPIGSLGYRDIFAFSASIDGTLYGLRSTNEIVQVDPEIGRATIVGTLEADFAVGHAWGASFAGEHLPEPSTLLICLSCISYLRWRRVALL